MQELEEDKPQVEAAQVFAGLKAVWELLGDQQRTMAFCVFMLLVCQCIFLTVPIILTYVFDALPRVVQHGFDAHFVGLLTLMALLPIIGQCLVRIVKEPTFLRSLILIENRVPMQAQEKLLQLSQSYHERENTGRKIARITKGCDSLIGTLTRLFWGILPCLVFLAINTVALAWIDWRLAAIFYAPFLPMLWLLKRMFDEDTLSWHIWHKDKEKSVGLMCQSTINVPTVQGYVQENHEVSCNSVIRRRMERDDVAICMTHQRMLLLNGILLQAAYITAICYGLFRAIRGDGSIGALVFLISGGGTSMHSLTELVMEYARMTRDLVSIVRVKTLLDQPVDVINYAPGVVPERVTGQLEFKQVTYRYPGKTHAVVEHFDLTVTPGQMLALVGRSGSGKSTLAKLAARVYDPSSGVLALDGVDAKALDRDWFRGLFAVVQQDVDIFDATLRDNVAYGCRDASDEEVANAVAAAHLSRTVSDPGRFPEGLLTEVGDRGVRLSGGERQRVGIARAYLALLRGARFLVLDEATASLDSEAERGIQEVIERLRGKTVIVIAHRLSTIHRADMICVLENGRIAEQGDHAALLRRNGLYAHLVELQRMGELGD